MGLWVDMSEYFWGIIDSRHDSIGITITIYFLLAIQLAFFVWWIKREINARKQSKSIWLPCCEILNIINMILTATICIVIPSTTNEFTYNSRVYGSSALVLIILHPINVLGHYNLLKGKNDEIFSSDAKANGLYHNRLVYFPAQEKIAISISIAIAFIAGLIIYQEGMHS